MIDPTVSVFCCCKKSKFDNAFSLSGRFILDDLISAYLGVGDAMIGSENM